MDGGSGGGGVDVFASSTAPLTWHDFLERMRHPSAADFVKSIKSFIVSFSNKVPDADKDSAAVQEFLANMEAAFRAHSLWAGCSEEELESAGEGLEKYVMTKLFNRAFASIPEDVKHDDELYEKMALVQQFIRPESLDIKPNFRNETSWLLAQKELQKMNMYKAPRDKLVCILNCCKVINNLLINASIASSDDPPGADEFLPVLIYVTIKANPPQLHSNLMYIQRYRRQSRLVSESAYFFTNILSAESFIFDIDANSLSMDEDDYQRCVDSARSVLSGLTSHLVNDSPSVDPVDSRPLKEETRDKPSVADLEKKGAVDLLREEQVNGYFQDYPFLYARAGDLTVADVESLLNCYKQLVIKYVSLSKAMHITNPSVPLLLTQGKEGERSSAAEDSSKKEDAEVSELASSPGDPFVEQREGKYSDP